MQSCFDVFDDKSTMKTCAGCAVLEPDAPFGLKPFRLHACMFLEAGPSNGSSESTEELPIIPTATRVA